LEQWLCAVLSERHAFWDCHYSCKIKGKYTMMLNDVAKLVREGDVENPELMEFINAVDDAASEILKDKDTEFLVNAVTFIQAAAMAEMLDQESDGFIDPRKLMNVVKLINDETFMNAIMIAFKFSVGLSAMEELR
jgi:hypothetical protein